jgi:hypothetical protein
MRWALQCPQDNTWHCGKKGVLHSWSINQTDAKIYPTYLLACIAMQEINQDYEGTSYYELAIRECPETEDTKMSNPFALLGYIQNTRHVLHGYAIDQPLINKLSSGTLITFGEVLGLLSKLTTQIGEDCPEVGGTEIVRIEPNEKTVGENNVDS